MEKKIVIVFEPNASFGRFIQKKLEGHQIGVYVASNLNVLQQYFDFCDKLGDLGLLILDFGNIFHFDNNGFFEIIADFRQKFPEIKIICYTLEDDDWPKLVEAGANCCLLQLTLVGVETIAAMVS